MQPTSDTISTFCDRPSVQDPFMSVSEFASDAERAFRIGEESTLRPKQWPMSSSLELGPLPSAVPCARIHARLVVSEWSLPDLADTVELIVSELVTNSLHASAELDQVQFGERRMTGPSPVRLWLGSDFQRVLIQVWDGNRQLPVRQNATPESESGRGLLLVESLSSDWGSYRSAACSGKVVWAVVA
jgi:hypothetical protein